MNLNARFLAHSLSKTVQHALAQEAQFGCLRVAFGIPRLSPIHSRLRAGLVRPWSN